MGPHTSEKTAFFSPRYVRGRWVPMCAPVRKIGVEWAPVRPKNADFSPTRMALVVGASTATFPGCTQNFWYRVVIPLVSNYPYGVPTYVCLKETQADLDESRAAKLTTEDPTLPQIQPRENDGNVRGWDT
ncbi:hypothetical protein C8R43DRAFT_960003 [Mycena crocata]|nr:hypothetical protein C8R43DRAFT_960003 [Mycena crocata]